MRTVLIGSRLLATKDSSVGDDLGKGSLKDCH
jgi:hypothetical protein